MNYVFQNNNEKYEKYLKLQLKKFAIANNKVGTCMFVQNRKNTRMNHVRANLHKMFAMQI